MKTNRQKRWLEQGYTQEQINNHLKLERYKSKQARERRKRNNENNKEIIAKIKNDILEKTFTFKNLKVKILSIRPTNDGIGFWYKMTKEFSDGSSGEFRQFYHFDDYNKKEFIKYLAY